MSLFWENFNNNRKTKHPPVAELRESLAETCESFALLRDFPRWQKRQILLTELKKLADFYRRSEAWEGTG